jgi:hypothetical protein
MSEPAIRTPLPATCSEPAKVRRRLIPNESVRSQGTLRLMAPRCNTFLVECGRVLLSSTVQWLLLS